MAFFEKAEVTIGPIYDIAQILEDPHVDRARAARGLSGRGHGHPSRCTMSCRACSARRARSARRRRGWASTTGNCLKALGLKDLGNRRNFEGKRASSPVKPDLPVWRSLLYVPVNVEKYVDKAHTRGADCIQLDLEDSVPAAEKDAARRLVPAAAASACAAAAPTWWCASTAR